MVEVEAMTQLGSEIEVDCPCCGSVLVVDFNLRRVVSHQQPEREDKPVLEDAHQILDAEAARREAYQPQSSSRAGHSEEQLEGEVKGRVRLMEEEEVEKAVLTLEQRFKNSLSFKVRWEL